MEVAEQPLALVTTTEYDPEVLTVMLWVVKLPGVHKYEFPELAVRTTDPPLQKVVGPMAKMIGTGFGTTVIVWLTVVETPFNVTVQVYVVVVVGDTVMDAVVAPPGIQE